MSLFHTVSNHNGILVSYFLWWKNDCQWCLNFKLFQTTMVFWSVIFCGGKMIASYVLISNCFKPLWYFGQYFFVVGQWLAVRLIRDDEGRPRERKGRELFLFHHYKNARHKFDLSERKKKGQRRHKIPHFIIVHSFNELLMTDGEKGGYIYGITLSWYRYIASAAHFRFYLSSKWLLLSSHL